jgi:hypothetical protein
MKKVNFIPKTDIDEYLNDDFNKEIFFYLTESEDRKRIFEPLEFLNLLYEQIEIIKANKEKPNAVVKHLLGLKLDKTKLYCLLFCLEVRIIKASNIAYGDNETYFKLNNCVDFIKRERKKLEAKLHTIPDGFENNLEEYLKKLDLFQKNEPEKYEAFKGIFDSIRDISIVAIYKFIEHIEFLFEKSKRDYSELTVSIARKEIFIREQLEIYEKANHRFQNFNDYTNNTFNKYQPIFTEALEYWKTELDNLKPSVTALPPQPIVKEKPIRYRAKEYALTYIFDLYATGQRVPIDRIEGCFDAKKIKDDVSKFPTYDKAPDTFYRAVKSVLEYDLNKSTDLQNISKDWFNAVRNLSTNWVKTEQYLKNKNLIGE